MEFELIPLEERPDLLNPLTKIVGDAFAGERNALVYDCKRLYDCKSNIFLSH